MSEGIFPIEAPKPNSIDYRPAPVSKAFIRDRNQTKLIQGPVGSGKSTACIFGLVYEGMQQEPDRDGMKRSRYAIVRNTNQQLMDTTFKSFSQFFQDGVAGKWKATEKTFVLKPAADIEIEFMFRPLDTAADIGRLLSLEVSGFWFNEAREINQDVFTAAVGRIGRYPSKANGGCTHPVIYMDTNPPEVDSWLYDLIEDEESGLKVYKQPPALIPGTTLVNPEAENLENLPENYYQLQVENAGHNEEYINVYLRNMYGRSNAGRPVFPMFNENIHVSCKPLIPNPLLPLYIGFDPGMSSGLTFGQMSLHGQLMVFDALSTSDMGTQRLIAEKLNPLLRSSKYREIKDVVVLPDPAANIRSNIDESTVVDMLKKSGFDVKFVDQNNQLLPRLEAVEYFLTRVTEVGPALLLDHEGCRPLIRALAGGYRYPKSTPSIDKIVPEKNEDSHVADSFQYLAKYVKHNEYREAKRKNRRFTIPQFRNIYAV